MHFTTHAQLSVPPAVAFDFITTPGNWPRFIHSARSVEVFEGWGGVGGRARVAGRFLGRSAVWEAEIVEWNPPGRFRYRLRRPGRPDLDNTRVLDAADDGTVLTAVTGMAVGAGVRGLVDRVDAAVVRSSTGRALQELRELLAGQEPSN